MRILYVEDEADIREVATLALETVGGFTVEACSSGEQALRAFASFKPDLIVLDVMMPGMDGPTTLKRLRAIPEAQDVPAVFMTAKVQPHEIAELKALGALDVIPKPFDPMTLSRTISDLWATHAAQQAPSPPRLHEAPPSQYRDAIAQIAEAFASALPDRVKAISTLYRSVSAGTASAEMRQSLHRDVHSLTGSAATFGFPLVSQAARALELQLKTIAASVEALSAEELAHVGGLLQDLIRSTEHPREPIASVPGPPLPAAIAPTALSIEFKKLVYTLNDAGDWVDRLREQLADFGYELEKFADPEELTQACQRRLPTAIITDASQLESAGAQWIDSLRQHLGAPPALIVVSENRDLVTRLRAAQAGGIAYFVQPVKTSSLVEQLDALSVQGSPEPYRVMIVEDSEEQAAFYSAVLHQANMLTREVCDPAQLLEQLAHFQPELVLMDMYLPGCTGDALARVMRQMDEFRSLPIVFLSVEADFDRQLAAMGLGGDEFLTKPILPEQLVSVVSRRVERYRILRAIMVQDSLTGLANHSHLHQVLETEVARALRDKDPLSLAMIDVDHFKLVNDRHGHPTGDRVLQSLARFIRQRLRKSDVVARYGGEEFAVVLGGTDAANAVIVIDKLREQFATLAHDSDRGETFSVTFSAGVAALSGRSAANQLVLAADRALYEAKHAGRNCVSLSRAPDLNGDALNVAAPCLSENLQS
ncbi:MAG: response regulator [Betaproteobacteria bacterium]